MFLRALPGLRGVFAAMVGLGLGAAGHAAEVRITAADVGPDGRAVVSFVSDPAAYYLLERGDRVDAIATPVNSALGQAGAMTLADREPQVAREASFYRLREVPRTAPLDSDGDGIDDVYELERPAILDPLNPADALADPPLADLPRAGDEVLAGGPLLTVFASAPSVQQCDAQLRQRVAMVEWRPYAVGR
ncbi:MAG TPA: hypothetical protein PKE47_03185 [Verrucomicrobiota bacterium]|nr:hypothetical protein [Verrucomicrobiota bacterium]